MRRPPGLVFKEAVCWEGVVPFFIGTKPTVLFKWAGYASLHSLYCCLLELLPLPKGDGEGLKNRNLPYEAV